MVDMQIDGMFEISNLCLTHDVHDIQNKMEKRVKLQPFRN